MKNSTGMLNAIRWLASLLFISLLAACGGGDGGTSSSTSLSGVAATGAAMANASITVYDATGKSQTTTADANGNYTLSDVSGLKAPLLVVAKNNTYTLTALVASISGDTVVGNINQLTDRIAADVSGLGTQALIDLFKAGSTSSITSALITEKTQALRTEIAAALTAAGLDVDGFDPVSIVMQVGDAFDKVLDQVSFSYGTDGKIVTKAPAPCTVSTEVGTTLNADKQLWCGVAFGQSVDLNFASTILTAKVGTNNVWFDGTKLAVSEAKDLNGTIAVESRGGKIANTHDGLTFYYTRLSTGVNFVLEADVTVEQFGPEDGTTKTNAQEGAGLMVRDVIGAPRQEPMKTGYEEFPSASNMVMNAIMTNGKNNTGDIVLQSIYRDGVNYKWGNTGAIIPKATYKSGLNWKTSAPLTIKMKLERTDSGFVVTYADADGSNEVSKTVSGANANIVQTIDPDYMEVGFFASRNARIVVKNAKLTLSKANTADVPKYTPTAIAATHEIASPSIVAGSSYLLQGVGNYDGSVSVTQDGVAVKTGVAASAGEFYSFPLTIANASSTIVVNYTPSEGPTAGTAISKTVTVTKHAITSASTLYASPTGSSGNLGTEASPLDVTTAINLVAPGGTVYLLDGTYSAITIGMEASGAEGQLKTMVPKNAGMVSYTGSSYFKLAGSYWHIKGLEIYGVTAGNGMRITGSHNKIEEVITHDNKDAGLQISATSTGAARAMWPKNNLVLNSESYNNADDSYINADGFAAKLGVGDGNVFRGCIAHHNADDGWDLFNKIEEGANGVVTIENSIAYNNGMPPSKTNAVGSIGNGFKLGGEGYPVAHIVRNNLSFDNNMDGFTDNFNPGALVMDGNVSLNNARFNFIFRPGPFATAAQQGKFTNNASLRTDGKYADTVIKYSDAVTGVVDNTNYFYNKDSNTSVNAAGTSISTSNFQSIEPPLVNGRFQRNADGSIILNGFLQRN